MESLSLLVDAVARWWPAAGVPVAGPAHPFEPLQDYRARVQAQLDAHLMPDAALARADHAHLPALMEDANARRPGLDLRLFESPGRLAVQIADDLASGRARRWRGVVYLAPAMSDEPGGRDALAGHAVAVDVKIGRSLASIVCIDSSSPDPLAQVGTEISTCVDSLLRHARGVAGHAVVTPLSTRAQKSAYGCRLFALCAASDAATHHRALDPLHAHAFELARHAEGEMRCVAGPEPQRLLPASFYRHAHSSEWLRSLAARADPAERPDFLSLVARAADARGTYTDGPGGIGVTYSASIDFERLRRIDEAIATGRARAGVHPANPPSSR